MASTFAVPGYAVDVAVSPDSARLYVLSSEGVVYTFDASSGRVLAKTEVDASPTGLALVPNGDFLYVASQPDNPVREGVLGGPSLAVIDTRTEKVIANPRLPEPGPTAIAASPDGRYVAVADAHAFDLISTSTRAVAETIAAPDFNDLYALTFGPDNSRIFSVGTTEPSGAGVFISVDTVTKTVASGPAADGIYSDIVADPNGRYLYATISSSGAHAEGSNPPPLAQTAQVLNARTLAVERNLKLGDGLGGISFGPGAHAAYVTDLGKNEILAINTTTRTVVATIRYANHFVPFGKGVPDFGYGITVAPDGQYAYLTGYYAQGLGSPTVEAVRL